MTPPVRCQACDDGKDVSYGLPCIACSEDKVTPSPESALLIDVVTACPKLREMSAKEDRKFKRIVAEHLKAARQDGLRIAVEHAKKRHGIDLEDCLLGEDPDYGF